ncbi:tripartite tricarboxylate transporter substrate binding protein [Paucibacter sp. PLA-PC-4]|uniref:Bug family tripartite tricarboxylate transporter substrate binding protein n=1 Tax=Paucibacter sp. PLA-PC-4 TaxID=2993655 RepID=UPI002B05372C|nr:tripartite tricarboxylate transporter substrate binding protein [Paucibacter sp. PLA-PC-4]
MRPANPTFSQTRRAMATFAALCCGSFALGPAALASEWPDKVVKIVIPFAPGGATDLLGRSLAVEIGREWKQTVIVDNRAGAGGAVGAQAVAKSPADGYTLLLASSSMFTVNQHIYSKLPYGLENFELISKVASGPMVVSVNADLPVRNTRELLAYVKANPGKLQFASAGIGSQTHIAGEAFADAGGLDILHVPYKGEGPAYSDLMAGVVQVAVANINAISPLLKGGRVRALSVTGKDRSPLLPGVPTTSEDGLPGFEFVGWFALMAPAGTPKPITAQMVEGVKRAVAQPGMKRYLDEQGMMATTTAGDALNSDIQRESVRWKALVTKRKISAN